MKKKEITIEDLALMVGKGFQSVDKRFDGIDRRLDRMDKRFDRIEKLILAEHKERIEKLEMEVKELKELIAFN
ncbi:MAG: hypothetical protein WC420_02745 [Candidatus Paceibacterota bacterium]|jgi:archaellum component FlaC